MKGVKHQLIGADEVGENCGKGRQLVVIGPVIGSVEPDVVYFPVYLIHFYVTRGVARI